MRYVRVKKFAELSGYTEKAVYQKIGKGVWLEGKHYRRAPDGNILLNTEEIERWFEGDQALA
jgi:hypothetical protein